MAPQSPAATAIAPGQTASAPPAGKASAKAAEACEEAVTHNLRDLRGNAAQRIEFNASRRVLASSAPQGDETSVKGAGRYGSTPFTYSCTYNAKSDQTNGIVISDKGGPARPADAEKPWQPDLTRLSPEACEAAVAASLKAKYPRVGRIALGSDSRQLKPAANGNTFLDGKGGLERAPGMSSVPFSYRCEFDARTGKLVGGAKIFE